MHRKEELLKSGMEYLFSEPFKVDLMTVLPLLLDNGNYISIVDLVLRKAKSL